MRRVVVTGLGMVSPMACGVQPSWQRVLAGQNAAARITEFETEDLPVKIACQVPRGDGSNDSFNADDWMEPKEQRKVDDFIIFAVAAAQQAIQDSGWTAGSEHERCRAGTLIGSGIGGLKGIAETTLILHERGPRRVSPFFIPGRLINLASGHVSIRFGLKGPNHSVVTACSTGAHAIGDAARLIMLGDADVMIAGGTESPLCRLTVAGFAACRSLSTAYNDAPQKASRPFDQDRDGFVLGEGAGIVVLEAMEHAQARGARIYAELVGYGLSGDAYHITAPSEDGDGAYRCMSAALGRAACSPRTWTTSTHGIDDGRHDRIRRGRAADGLRGSSASMSSDQVRHRPSAGRAGAVEAIFSILAIRDQVAPPTLNLDRPEQETPLDLVPHVARQRSIRVALSNSFGFGGTNASLIFRAYDASAGG